MFEDRNQDHLYQDLYGHEEAPPHPGEVLREDVFPKLGVTKKALAAAMGISSHKLAGLFSERTPVTFDLARRLGVVLGHGARYWLGLQVQFDLWQAAQPIPGGLNLLPLTPQARSAASKPSARRR